MSNPEDVMGDLNSLISKAMGAQLVQDVVHAYDAYATAAMQACIRLRGTELSATQIAECAWDFADKMMAERRKRGIGGFSEQLGDEKTGSIDVESFTKDTIGVFKKD